MKKLLSVCLALIMMLSVFSITSSALQTYEIFQEGNLFYYLTEENTVHVCDYVFDNVYEPKGALTIPETVTHHDVKYTVTGVETEALYASTYTSITLPSTITYIGDYAFSTCDFLEDVIVPEDCHFDYFGINVFLTTPFETELYSQDEIIFGKNVLFSYIGNADEYVIPEEIDILANNCFFMSGVKNVVFNDKIAEIPEFTFASCRNLTEITIPDSVEYIGEGAFKDCTSLEKITLGENVCRLGVDCFANTKIKSIHLGQSVYEISGAFRDCKTLESITVDVANTALIADGNAIYLKTTFIFDGEEKDGLILEYYLPSKAQGKVTLKSNVGAIGEYAFYGCNGLQEVVAKELEYVDTQAFCNSSIKKFSANSNYMVWDSAFRNCKNLETINLEKVDYIGMGAFENCTALKEITLPQDVYAINELAFANTGITEITIYGDDCYIYESAFKGCKNLETVRLEEGVTSVGANTFLGCPELKTIYISKTVKEFDDNAFSGCEDVLFQIVSGSKGHDFIKKMGYSFETVGRVSLLERIVNFFDNILEILFGWILF